MTEKRAARRESFARIRALSSEEKETAARAIVSTLSESSRFRQADTIFSYLALPSEPDLSALQEAFPEKTWGYSRVLPNGEELAFHEVSDPVGDLREGSFGFLEPDPERCPQLDVPDLVLVPGVAFSPTELSRLGRGKGHYDRFLSGIPRGEGGASFLGICFSVQLRPLDPEPHDVPMDAVVTELGWSPGSTSRET